VQYRAGQFAQFALVRGYPGLQNHDRGDGFAEIRIGNADDRRLENAGQLVDHLLDLFGVDVKAARDYEILRTSTISRYPCSSRNPKSPVMKYPSGVNSVSLNSETIPVFGENVRTANFDAAGRPPGHANLDAGQRGPDRSGFTLT